LFRILRFRFWEKAIPLTDKALPTLIAIFISNHAIQELMRLATSGTPLVHLVMMFTGNRCARSAPAIASRPVGGS
jgi:hypothetical protein